MSTLTLTVVKQTLRLTANTQTLALSTSGPTLNLGVETGMAVTFPQFIVLFDDDDAGLTYVGEAVPGTATSAAAWRIKRLDETESGDEELLKKFANGSINFDQVWDDRTTLAYS